jgi:hypothetical protein
MDTLQNKVEKAYKLRWLFLPAMYTFAASFFLRKDAKIEKDKITVYTFDSLNVMIVYFGIIFIIVSQLLREPVPYIIMT